VRYQVQYLLGQVRHQVRAQRESGQVQEWLFPLEKALERALEDLQQERKE
jgi:hypothetical protein